MDAKSDRQRVTRPGRSKKRCFRGNRHTSERDTASTSASARKISKTNGDFTVPVDDALRYFIVNFGLFLSLQERILCKECVGNVKFMRTNEKGLGFKLIMRCDCSSDQFFLSCPMIGQSYEINRRFIFVMRFIGVGFNKIRDFCGYMDFGLHIGKSSYYEILEHISIAVRAVAQLVLQKAATEERDKNEAAGNVRNHLSISGDGSWAKRGFTSLVGIVSLIGKYSGKVLDVIVKSSVCKMCESKAGKEDDVEYDSWYEEHQEKCTANHEGSAGKMEVDGVIEMFQRSLELHDVYYKNYIGDGDTKTFKNLQDASPYGNEVEVKKLECVLHVKKRLYKRAKDAKKNLTQQKKTLKTIGNIEVEKSKTTRTSKRRESKRESKTVSTPKVKTVAFTNKVMLQLSTYYEAAIYNNANSIDGMRNAILATLYHKISTDSDPQHSFCPEGKNSWCKYRVAEASNTLQDFKHPPALVEDIQPALKKIYEDLSTDELLSRCLGANTQNNNESFNAVVWRFAPKHVYSGKNIIELATNLAVCIFNEGYEPLLKIMDTMGITIGNAAVAIADANNNSRILRSDNRSSQIWKDHRMEQRDDRARRNEHWDEEEGELYGPGIAE